jgi:hypothetical protein
MGQCLGIRKGSNDNVIEKLSRNGKTYFNITNYENYMAYLDTIARSATNKVRRRL